MLAFVLRLLLMIFLCPTDWTVCISPYTSTPACLAHGLLSLVFPLIEEYFPHWCFHSCGFPTPACLSAYLPPREVLSSFKFLLLLKVPETLLTYGAKQKNWVPVMKSFRCCCLQLVEIEATGSLPGA